MRRLIALVLGGCAVVLSVALAAFAATCGARSVPGDPTSSCASAFSTFHVVYAVFALAGALGAWFGVRWVPAAVGGCMALWGIVNAAGVGIYALPIGLVLIACAAFLPTRLQPGSLPGTAPAEAQQPAGPAN